MTHKFSDKFKIILAILAVTFVAAVAVGFTALSSNASDSQNSLYANSQQTDKAVSADSGKTTLSAPEAKRGGSTSATYNPDSAITNIVVSVKEISEDEFYNFFEIQVSGVDCIGVTIGQGIYVDNGMPNFEVTEAGTYTVSVKIKDTSLYQWENVEGDTATAEFKVNQAVENTEKLDAKNLAYSPDLTVNMLKSNVVGEPYKVILDLYSDSQCTIPLTEDGDIKVGAVYAKAESLDYSDKDARNYRLPDAGVKTSFQITPCILNSPSAILADRSGFVSYYDNVEELNFPSNEYKPLRNGDHNASAMYYNYDYKISHWFDQSIWTGGIGSNGYAEGQYWKVTVKYKKDSSSEPEVVSDSVNYGMRNIGIYTVKIEPLNGNYQFGVSGSDIPEYTWTVNPYRLTPGNFEWKDNKREYNDGKDVVFGSEDCIITGLFGDDELAVTLEIVPNTLYNDKISADGNPTGAGVYTFKVKDIVGEAKDKYTISETSKPSHDLTVYRKELPDFKTTIGTVVNELYFNGVEDRRISVEQKLLEIGLIKTNGKGELEYPLTSLEGADTGLGVFLRYPSSWGLGTSSVKSGALQTEFIDADSQEFFFIFTHAGIYDVTFTAGPGSVLGMNYCWAGGSKNPGDLIGNYTWTDFASVERAEVDPSLPNTVIPVNETTRFDIASHIKEQFAKVGVDETAYTLKFGKIGTSGEQDSQMDWDSANGKYIQGDYYVSIVINDGFYPDCYFASSDNYTVSDNGKRAQLDYSVSDTKVNITCKINPYTFGDSFADGFGIDDVVTVTCNTAVDVVYGATDIKFYTNSAHTQSAVLHNGVPRNAGSYYVVVTVEYTLNGVNQTPWSHSYSLEVSKRPVVLAWTLDGVNVSGSKAVSYQGQSYTVAAANTNTVNGVENVTVSLQNSAVKDFGDYTFTVDSDCIVGTEANNYTVDNVENATFTLTINRAEITVTASDVSDIEYKQTFTLPNPAYTVMGTFFGNENDGKLSVAVYNKDGNLVSPDSYASLSLGTYSVVPVWGDAPASMPSLTDNRYVTEQGNYAVTMIAKSFTVTAQTLKIELQSASGAYGDALNLWDVIKSVSAGSVSMSADDLKDIAKIVATLGNTVITAEKDGMTVTKNGQSAAHADVGVYSLEIVLNNSDFTMEVTNASAKYTVTKRAVTIQANDVLDHAYGDDYAGRYSGYEIIEGSLADGENSSVWGEIKYQVREIGYNGQFVDRKDLIRNLWDPNVTGGLCSVGSYYHVLCIGNVGTITEIYSGDGKRFYYTKESGNYQITVVTGKFEIIPRVIELTFSGGSAVYGDVVSLWTQQDGRYLSDYCSAEGLRKVTLGSDVSEDTLYDVINLTLIDASGSAFGGNAGTYYFKASVKEDNPNYKIKSGNGAVDELINNAEGCVTFVVSPKAITVTVSASKPSVTYGNSLTSENITLSCNIPDGSLINGDNLGETVCVYGSDGAIADISTQNVGADYYVGLTWTNKNYTLKYDKVGFEITKRSASITANSVSGHVYGEAYSDTLGFTAEARGDTTGFVLDEHWRQLTVTLKVLNDGAAVTDFASLAVKTGGYVIDLQIANANGNYDIKPVKGAFEVVPRAITITAVSVEKHIYGAALADGELKYDVSVTNGTDRPIINDADKAALNVLLQVYKDGSPVTNAGVAALPVGEYAINVDYTQNANYAVTVDMQNAVFKVVTLEITVTYVNNLYGAYGENIDLSGVFTVEGTLLDGDELIVSAVKNGVSAASYKAPVGEYTVTVTAPGNNYTVKFANGTTGVYNIKPRQITLSAQDVDFTYGDSFESGSLDGKWNATVSNGTGSAILDGDSLGITATIYNGETSVNDGDVSRLDVDRYTIKLSYTENGNYIVTQVNDAKFVVNQREITIKFVEAQPETGYAGIRHSTYNANPSVVTNTLYSNKVIVLGENDLVNGSTIQSVLRLSAVNENGVDVTSVRAPAGEYTITASVIDRNYKLKDGTTTGTYVIGKEKLQLTGLLQGGTFPYTGAPQKLGNAAYQSVDGSTVTVQYVLAKNTSTAVTEESAVDWTSASSDMPSVTDVSNNVVYMRAFAENHVTAFMHVDLNVTPVTITVTAKDVTLNYFDELQAIANDGKLPSDSYKYTQTANNPQGGAEYSGLIQSVLDGYLAKLTGSTNYTRGTAANAKDIKITPVYDNGSAGDGNVTVVCVAGTVTVNPASITDVTVESGHASGAYTGSEYKLFGTMSATVINSQPITWYYREQGGTNWIEYNNQTLTEVCSKSYEIKVSAPNHNDVILDVSKAITFVITQNSITIAIDNQDITYGNELTSVTFTATVADLNGLTEDVKDFYVANALSGDNLSVSGYGVKANAGKTFTISSSYTGDGNVRVTITNGILTVVKRSVTVTYVNGKSHVYGNEAALYNALYSVQGLVDGDELNVTVKHETQNDEMASKSPAGIYVVTVTDVSGNYEVGYANETTGSYTVEQREITASLAQSSVEYTEDVVDGKVVYHGGQYGKTQLAVIDFNNLAQGDEFTLGTSYVVTYALEGNNSATPNVAGQYLVTVTLNDRNYKLSNSAALNYEITRKQISETSVYWKDSNLEVKAQNVLYNVMEQFVSDFFKINSFTVITGSGSPVSVEQGDSADDRTCYYFDNGLKIKVKVDSTQVSSVYSIEFTLNSDAVKNYELTGGNGTVIREFGVSSVSVEAILTQSNWQYSDSIVAPLTQTIIDGVKYHPVQGTPVIIRYAPVLSGQTSEAKGFIGNEKGFDFAQVSHLFNDGDLIAVSDRNYFDVGYYVVCVTYSGLVQADNGDSQYIAVRRFAVFEVTKKVLTAPTFDSVTYDGNVKNLTVDYSQIVHDEVKLSDIVYAHYNNSDINSGSTISETNVGEYNISFIIKTDASEKYTWSIEKPNDLTNTVVWRIEQDENSNDDCRYFEISNVKATYGDELSKTDPSMKDGYTNYGGRFVWNYAPKAPGSGSTDGIGWFDYDNPAELKFRAGEYWLKVTLTDGNNNFIDKVAYAVLTIDKKELTLTPSVNMTYGEAFTQDKCGYTLTGFAYEQNESTANVKVEAIYSVTGYSEQQLTKLPVLKEGSYTLHAECSLTADNYTIKAIDAQFNVSPKNITVKIGNASGQFGLDHSQSKSGVTVTYIVADGEVKVDESDVIAGVKEALTINADEKSNCGEYSITSGYENGNFVITWDNGVFKVEQRQIIVTLNNGTGAYKGEFNPVTFNSVTDKNGQAFEDVQTQDNGKKYQITVSGSVYTLTIVYNGQSNSGEVFANSSAYPTLAGGYTATVTGEGSANFTFTCGGATFNVSKFTVHSENIKTESQMYTGHAVEPKLSDTNDYKGVSASEVYFIAAHSGFVNAGPHDVYLELSDVNNYEWSQPAEGNDRQAVIKFIIASAGIYAIPYGTITYGDKAQGNLHVKFKYASGDLAGQDAQGDIVSDGECEYIFVNKETGEPVANINLDQLEAGTYYLTLKTENGFVVGFKSNNANYANIALRLDGNKEIYGEFVVEQRKITIKPVDTKSVYSQDIPAAVKFELCDETTLASFDSVSDIAYAAKVSANKDSNQGEYEIVITEAVNKNYIITPKNGTHTIAPIIVEVGLSKRQDGVYDTTDAIINVDGLTASNYDGYEFSSDFVGKLVFVYSGTQFDGTPYSGGTMPYNAGNYTSTVDGISDDKGNFVLKTKVTAEFEIAKKIVDENAINLLSKMYNGAEQSHGLENGDGYTVSADTYKNAGKHNVTLTLTSVNNYEWSEHKTASSIMKTFEITKAPLSLKPNGTITYGDSFAANVDKYGFELIGLVGEDVNKGNGEIVTGSVRYSLAEGDGSKLNANSDGYEMLADVSGLQSANYEISVQTGLLIVNKRQISIKPVASYSYYGENVTLSNDFVLTADSNGMAFGDEHSVINYRPFTVATSESDVGGYAVNATAVSANYEITVIAGTHTILKAKVGVKIRPINGTYGDANNRGGVEFMSTVIIRSDGTTEQINGLQFLVAYVGVAYDGTEINGSEVPAKAGIYDVSVTAVTNNGNYEIDGRYGISSTVLEIFKRQIDAGNIHAVNAQYTGSAITPVIEDNLYNVDGTVVYTVSSGLYVEVKEYDVTLVLVDTDNNEWKDNLNRTTSIKFEITKADNGLVDEDNPQAPADTIKIEISDWTFDGEASVPHVSVVSGTENIVFEYASSENGAYTTEVPKDAGEYWVRATVAASDNYNAFVSRPTKFVIAKQVVQLPVVTNLSDNSVYTGSMLSLSVEGFDDRIMSLTMDSGMYRADAEGKLNLLALNADTYKAVFSLRNDNNYVWADNAELVDGSVIVNWTVQRQVVKRLPDASGKILVNGEDIVFTPEGFNSGIMIIEGNVHAHEGSFNAVVTLKDTKNYVWEDTDSPSITVNFELTGTNTAFIAAMCVVAGLCVGLAVMAVILTLVFRRKKRKEAEAIAARSRADGWEGE